MDAAHGGWLGWADNLKPTAQIFVRNFPVRIACETYTNSVHQF
jgi:cellulase/cellobiase CelA1